MGEGLPPGGTALGGTGAAGRAEARLDNYKPETLTFFYISEDLQPNSQQRNPLACWLATERDMDVAIRRN
ncbi:unannotated protein [freshwater metagenome]|uniref:Unannotated protein n=1 Tax=freshwater metagenome TaxID=449393 RepID=A0A6J6HPJ5_9ZZZZ